MPTATSVPDFKNAPTANGALIVPNQAAFEAKTEENRSPVYSAAFSGVNTRQAPIDLPKRGIYLQHRLRLVGSVTIDKNGGTVALKDTWLDGLLQNLTFRANGTDVHSVSGQFLHARRMRQFRNPDLSDVIIDETVPGTDGTYDFEIEWLVPAAVNMSNGIGSVYAESDGSQFQILPTWAPITDLVTLTGSADVAITGTLHCQSEYLDVPRDNVNGQEVVYVPDLSRLFMMIERDFPVTATGNFGAEISRSNGNLMCLSWYLKNNGANIDQSLLDRISWNYGVNQTPREYRPARHLLAENAELYNGLLPYNIAALDFETVNPVRNSVRPRSVTDLQVVLGVPTSGLTLVNARVHMVEESLIKAVGAPTVTIPDNPN